MLSGRLLDRIHQISNATSVALWIALMAFPWLFYVAHLGYMMRVQKRRAYLIMMWVLGAVVLLNLRSCADFFHNPPEQIQTVPLPASAPG